MLLVLAVSVNKVTEVQPLLKVLAHPLLVQLQQVAGEVVTTTVMPEGQGVLAVALEEAPLLLVVRVSPGKVLTAVTPQATAPLEEAAAVKVPLVEIQPSAATELLETAGLVVPMRSVLDQTSPMQVAVVALVLLVALKALVVLVEAVVLLVVVEQQTPAAVEALAFQAAVYGLLRATAALASSSFDTGLRNGTLRTN